MKKRKIVAVDPPRPLTPYARTLGLIAAVVMGLAALLHLFRIDQLVPVLDHILPGGTFAAAVFTCVLVAAEVFALPFLMRMRLSPLAQFCSGAMVVLAPLLWVLLVIWGLGAGYPTNEFGGIVQAKATLWLLLLNFAWLAGNYTVLWLLGYNTLEKYLPSRQTPKRK